MMPDRDNAIDGLNEITHYDGEQMFYNDIFIRGIAEDALLLLKEQEAKPPAIMQDVEGIWSTCSICGHKLRALFAMEMDTYFPKFCSECGQAVKWN